MADKINYGDNWKVAREKINNIMDEVEAHIPSIWENNHWYLWETDTWISATWPQWQPWPQGQPWPQWNPWNPWKDWEPWKDWAPWQPWQPWKDWEDWHTPVKWVDYFTQEDIQSLDIPKTASDIWALPDSTKYWASISLSINSSTYAITAQLKDQDWNSLWNSQTVDLPLESVVVGWSYDDQTKKVILTLENGNTIEFSVADLVAWLQSEITAQNKLDSDLVDDTNQTNKFVTTSDKNKWDWKQDTIIAGTNISIANDWKTISATDTKYTATDFDIKDLADSTGKRTVWDWKQDALSTQTAYTSKWTATKVPQITTNTLWQVTGITEIDITHPAQAQTDRNEADNTKADFIKNKPTLWTAAALNTGTSSWNIPVLDSNWKLNKTTLPWVALTDTFTVSTSSDLTSLSSAEQWDLAIVTTENKTYVLASEPYSTAANWKEILSPTGWVTSVNSQTWAVTLDADDISDSTTTNKFVTATDKTTWSGKQDALTLPATPTQWNLVTWGADNKTLVDWWAVPTGVPSWWTNGQVLTNVSWTPTWANPTWWSTTLTVTLASANWSNKSITVTATGVTVSNTVIVSPAPANINDYATNSVYCSAQGSGTLTFSCNTEPTVDIDVNVLIMS